MKTVNVYGPGCKRCEATETMVKDAASRRGVEVVKVTDAKPVAMAGVMPTPGISVESKLVHAGGLPNSANLDAWLKA